MTFLERLQSSFAQFAEFVPALFGALIILFAGYLLAKLVERGTERLLRRMRLNYLLERGGVMQAVERSGSHFNPSRILANLVFWFVMFVVIMIAANALGMETLADVFSELVGYIPSMMAAIVLLIVGIVLGRFVGGLILASAGAIQGGPTLARVGRWGVILLAIFMALQQLGIANEIVVTAFAILFGAVALALALSFGLGNRELAGKIARFRSRPGVEHRGCQCGQRKLGNCWGGNRKVRNRVGARRLEPGREPGWTHDEVISND
jgi:hypothetical protein